MKRLQKQFVLNALEMLTLLTDGKTLLNSAAVQLAHRSSATFVSASTTGDSEEELTRVG